ncbi:MAG: hypothetical protein EBU87_11600 [Betaproteobacteria bacterium]|nr:hypothetical protein [Betaproteobacteria bacterium]
MACSELVAIFVATAPFSDHRRGLGVADAAVSSSNASSELLRSLGIRVIDPNTVEHLPLYVDGADEVDPQCRLIKGGGGALTREKILADLAERFVCIVDEAKCVPVLGGFPLPIEVLALAV